MRGRNSFGYRRCSRLDWGQSGLDLQTTELIPAGVINPEIGVFLWSKSTLQTHGRELGGCTAFGVSDCSACLQHLSILFLNLSAKIDGRYRMLVPKYCHQIQWWSNGSALQIYFLQEPLLMGMLELNPKLLWQHLTKCCIKLRCGS